MPSVFRLVRWSAPEPFFPTPRKPPPSVAAKSPSTRQRRLQRPSAPLRHLPPTGGSVAQKSSKPTRRPSPKGSASSVSFTNSYSVIPALPGVGSCVPQSRCSVQPSRRRADSIVRLAPRRFLRYHMARARLAIGFGA